MTESDPSEPARHLVSGRTPPAYRANGLLDIVRRGLAMLGPLIREVLWEHRRALMIVGIYIGLGGGLLTFFGRPWPIKLMYPVVALAWGGLSALYLFWLWATDPVRFRQTLTPAQVLGSVIVACLLVPFQLTFQSLKFAIGYSVGFPWDDRLALFDKWLHGGPAWEPVAWAYDWPRLLHVGFYVYQSGWLIVAFLVLVWATWHPDRRFRDRVLLGNLLVWIFAGTVAAYAFASAGPCYVEDADYRAVTAKLEAAGVAVVEWQRSHWIVQVTQRWHPFAGVSAFPSLHIAIATLVALLAWERSRRAGLIFAVFAVWIEIWSVILNWHYAIDGYAGAVIAWCCWRGAGRLTGPSHVAR
jgi:hypothetical protein